MSGSSKSVAYAGVGTAELADTDEDIDGYRIHGVALGAGDITVGQSGVKKLWPGEELQKAAETLEGTDLVRDHQNNTKGKVGEVTYAEYVEDLGVIYEAEIAPHYEDLANDVRAGLMEVSVRAYHKPDAELEKDESTDALIVEDIHFDNLSVVNNGASPSNTANAGPLDQIDANIDPSRTAAASASTPDAGAVATLERSAPVDSASFDRGPDELSVTIEDTPTAGEPVAPKEDDVFDTREEAESRAEALGCDLEAHQVKIGNESYYVPCSSPSEYQQTVAEEEASTDSECSDCTESELSDSTTEALASIEGTHMVEGTAFAIAPDEHSDDSTGHPDDAKYPMTSCTGEDSVESAWKMRGNGDYDIEQSTLENRIRRAAEAMDCDPSIVGMDEFESVEPDDAETELDDDDSVTTETDEATVDEPTEQTIDGDTDEESSESTHDDGDNSPVDADDSDTTPASPFAGTVPVATGIASAGSDQPDTNSTQTHIMQIDYEPADTDELSEELDEPVVVEQSELESLADEAEQSDAVQSELEQLTDKIDDEESAAETLSALDDEERDLLEADEDVTVVEASRAEMFDEVSNIYAEELAKFSPFEAEELAENFSPIDLKERLEDHDEAELAAQISETEPEPEAGDASDEELNEEPDEGEAEEAELREKYAEELEEAGWETQAEKVRAGELDIDA